MQALSLLRRRGRESARIDVFTVEAPHSFKNILGGFSRNFGVIRDRLSQNTKSYQGGYDKKDCTGDHCYRRLFHRISLADKAEV